MHVAAALDKNLVALYGSSDPDFTPPLNAKAQIVSLKLACAPCFKRDCPLGTLACLRDISPDNVLKLINAPLCKIAHRKVISLRGYRACHGGFAVY